MQVIYREFVPNVFYLERTPHMLLASYALSAGYVKFVCLVCDMFMFSRYKGEEIIGQSFTVDSSKLWSHIQDD